MGGLSTPHWETPLPQPRNIAIVAALVAAACTALAVPLAAQGGSAPAAGTPMSASMRAAVAVQTEVASINDFARRRAPAAVGSRCRSTLSVPGIGATCVTGDGLLRVKQADGRSHTIHGVDAPPIAASSYAPSSQAAVNSAGPGSIVCVGADEPHYTLVYSRPGNVASRYSTIAQKLRTEAYRLSAYLDSESRSVDPKQGRKLPFLCENGAPIVRDAPLPSVSAGSATFKSIVDGFIALGFEFNGDKTGNERYMVYFDSPSQTGAAGTGHVFTTDSSNSASNENNTGGLFAIEYRYAGGGDVPHWDVLSHEVLHTMGAVVDDAPNSSGARAGHCNDGQDTMCYSDGGSRSSYSDRACSVKVLDCNRNDYFNPSPAPGSFLATHWNTASPLNRFLRAQVGGDTTPPSMVGGLTQSGTSDVTIGMSWSAASDDNGVKDHLVSIRPSGGEWRSVGTTARTAITIAGLSPTTAYEVSVAARDAAGNIGPIATTPATTTDQRDETAPTAPAQLRVTTKGAMTVFTWREARDDVGVDSYTLRRVTTSTDNRRQVRATGTTRNTTLSIRTSSIPRSGRSVFELVARDIAANESAPARVTINAARSSRPSAPPNVRIVQRERSAVTIGWDASRSSTPVTQYHAYQLVGKRWVYRATLRANTRRLKLVRLNPGTVYTLRLIARDRVGNTSPPSRSIAARTR